MAIMKTYSAKSEEIEKEWFVADAEGQTLGRFASKIAQVLRGKHKPAFTPHVDMGDFVIVVNAEKIRVSGRKEKQKQYFSHSGYPGGIKETTPEKLSAKKPEEILKLAVRRMLPSGPLAKKQLTKLKIYKGASHPHESQNPKIIDFAKINSKNCISIN